MKSDVPANYRDIVTALKDKIRKARLRASLKLNADLLSIYREVGSTIADQSPDAENPPVFETILQGELAKITWYHHIYLLDKVKDPEIRAFYIGQTIQNGWSRDVTVHQIEGGLHKVQGKLTHNFRTTVDRSEPVTQIFKDHRNDYQSLL